MIKLEKSLKFLVAGLVSSIAFVSCQQQVMKRITQVLMAVLISAGSAFAEMEEDPETVRIKVSTMGTGVYNLKYNILEPSKVEVKILDEKGTIIHRDKFVAKKNFERKYNFQNYASGQYTFLVTDGKVTQSFKVDYDKGYGIDLKQYKDTRYVDLTVSVPNQRLVINIYNRKGDLVQSERIKTSYEGARRVYNLKNRIVGDSVIEVVNNFEVVKKIDM